MVNSHREISLAGRLPVTGLPVHGHLHERDRHLFSSGQSFPQIPQMPADKSVGLFAGSWSLT
jgi:hypothetical protein